MKNRSYPILFSFLFLIFAFESSSVLRAQSNNTSALKIKTICIDPGHGGKDGGAPGYDKKVNEKSIVLSIGTKLGRLIGETYPDIKVVYTRSTDVYVPLIDRAHVANRANADLFISIHCNSNENSGPHGGSIHVYGAEDKRKSSELFEMSNRICKQENSVILMEDGYSEKYQDFDPDDPSSAILFSLLHNAYYEQSIQLASLAAAGMKGTKVGMLGFDGGVFQNNFAVLRLTSVPSILVECGFISNKSDFDYLKSEAGQEEIARTLMGAINAYIAANDSSRPLPIKPAASEVAPAVSPAVAPAVEKPAVEKPVVEKPAAETNINGSVNVNVFYGVQALVSSKSQPSDPEYFAGNQYKCYPSGKVYKYVIGEYRSVQEAREALKKHIVKIPDAFVVKVDNGIIKPCE